jgi:hypothetical protein
MVSPCLINVKAENMGNSLGFPTAIFSFMFMTPEILNKSLVAFAFQSKVISTLGT